MQFGRVQGIALMALGLILRAIQGFIDMPPTQPTSEQITSSKVEKHVSPIFGIVGVISLVGGATVAATASRRDEPNPKNAVK
jgi:hypothetical protein